MRVRKELSPTIMWPWDTAFSPLSGAFGIRPLPPPGGVLGENAWSAPTLPAAFRVYTRIRRWTLFGSVTVKYGSGSEDSYLEGTINIQVPAVDYLDATMTTESQIAMHGGWKGLQDQGSFLLHEYSEASNSFETSFLDVGIMTMEMWRTVYFPVNDVGAGLSNGIVFPPPLLFLGGVALMGKNSVNDNCPVTCNFPVTHDGSFDGTNLTGFTLQLGSVDSVADFGGWLEGSLELAPAFWEYDPLDGDGPFYNDNTGAWLRTAELLDPALVV